MMAANGGLIAAGNHRRTKGGADGRRRIGVRESDAFSSQAIDVRDVDESTVFSGPMADAGDDSQLASPMPGVVEKIAVAAGQAVGEGDVLMTISAMKMEVQVRQLVLLLSDLALP